ncbi:MAG TPA: glycosyl hydrolase, partial [Candidatus Saccharimonadaceae bacterium]|nr:glycosyl hydrolase [Candidatus Saccharimonadaceae bacterium]
LPLALQPDQSGIEFSAPRINSVTSNVIAAPFTPNNCFSIEGARGYTLTRYDGVSADLTYPGFGTVTFAEGSPFIWYSATRAQTVSLRGGLNASRSRGSIISDTNGDTKVVAATTGQHDFSQASIQLSPGDRLVLAVLPASTPDSLVQSAAQHPIENVSTSHQVKNGVEQTAITYHIAGGGTTVLGALPYRTVDMHGKKIGQLDGLFGSMVLKQTNSIIMTAPEIVPSDTLPVEKLTGTQKRQLVQTLTADVPRIKLDATTSYAAGKQLYSAANLLMLAHQLDDQKAADVISTKLTPALEHWLRDGFYYDPAIHGVAPKIDNFGSSDFNDHHFHYGYFIYAADIVAQFDQSFTEHYRSYVDLLAADIASPMATHNFPAYRVFDAYAGHSWAAGLAPFSDGNDEESSSEAINAWNAVALWGQTTHDASLADTGRWLLANETQTAARIWLRKPTNTGYTAPLTDIVWGGKRVYQTWFSDNPVDKLAIQLIPMNPVEQKTLSKNQQIKQILNASISGDDYNQPLGDYALMYLALIDPTKASSLESSQTSIDSADSRTYLQAWIMT